MIHITGCGLEYTISRSRVKSKPGLLAVIKAALPQNGSQHNFTICIGSERLPWDAFDLPAGDFSVEVFSRAGKHSGSHKFT